MARPSAYSRGRRIVMQATMFGVFLATLGLAALVARSRERASAVELETKPLLAERLAIRLPKGWAPDQDSLELPIEVSARENVVASRREPRVVTVLQTDAPPVSPIELLQRYLAKYDGVYGEPEPFILLDEAGAMCSFERIEVMSEKGEIPIARQVPGWYAAAVLPKAGPDGKALGVVVGVQGEGAAGPAGRQLVRQLADGLAVRLPSAATEVPRRSRGRS